MHEEEIRDVCKKIIIEIVDKLGVKVDDAVVERLTDGLINSIRAITFLSLARANDMPNRLLYRPEINLKGKWFPVRPYDVQRTIQHDLPIYYFRRELIPTREDIKLASSLEERYGLSNFVKDILFAEKVEKDISVDSIAFEAAVLNKFREKTLRVNDLQKLENYIGKWFG